MDSPFDRPIQAWHPTLVRYRSPRARGDRYAYGRAVTPVRLRRLDEAPREITRVSNEPVFEADGAAWTVLRQGPAPVPPAALAAFLEDPGTPEGEPPSALTGWARRSPLLFVEGAGRGRVGVFDATAPTVRDDGLARAGAAVRAFLDDRVRIHGQTVLVREERLVGLHWLGRARPPTRFGPEPRDGSLMFSFGHTCPLAVRPDRLDAAWEIHGRPRRGPPPSGPWDGLRTLPPSLLRDDDAEWLANRLPAWCLGRMRQSWFSGGRPAPAPEGLDRLATRLAMHARHGPLNGVTGDSAIDALGACAEALLLLAGLRMAARRPEDDDAAAFLTLMRVVRFEMLPRLRAGAAPEIDAVDLAGLAPG